MRHVLTGSHLAALIVLCACWLSPLTTRAQCDCDHTLETSVTVAVGDELGVGPGDRVCVTSGSRPFLRLQSFHGTAAEPITIVNCGGVVEISNTDRAYALVIEGASEHVRVSGTGEADIEYGFRVSAPDLDPYPGVGVWIMGRASSIEVDHMEVFDTGFAGVMAKTDPGCADRPVWDGFVMRDTHLHHLWVHDTGGEGFYIGSTQSSGYTRTCDGVSVTLPAHRMDGVSVHDVLIEDTGWDGIQIGFASRCTFTDSRVRRVGLERVEYQMQGVQLGSSDCELRRLDLRDGAAMGVIALDASNVTIADSLIANFEGDGIYLNLRSARAGHWNIVHNTIAGSGGAAARGFGTGQLGESANNLVFGNATGALQLPSTLTSRTNLELANAAAAGVVSADDLHLTATSAARGAGTDLTSMGYAIDLDGQLRASPPAVGAYELRADSPDAGVALDAAITATVDAGTAQAVEAGTIADASRPHDTGAPTDGGEGCGCRAGHAGGTPLRGLTFLTLGLACAARAARSVKKRRTQRRA